MVHTGKLCRKGAPLICQAPRTQRVRDFTSSVRYLKGLENLSFSYLKWYLVKYSSWHTLWLFHLIYLALLDNVKNFFFGDLYIVLACYEST